MTIGKLNPSKLENMIDEPRMTKNITMKKSLNDFTLLAISKCSDELASAMPAKKPPISKEKPTLSTSATTRNAHAKLVKNKSSWDLAILSKIKGRTFLPIQSISAKRSAPLKTVKTTPPQLNPSPV